MPAFSIVIPLYNKQDYIKQTIISVLNQSISDFELLIINDCSTDNSLEIVKSFNDNRIQIINHETNKGLSASRNTGIQNSTADFVTFIDADDIWYDFFLATIDSLIKNYPEASIFGTNYLELHANNTLKEPQKNISKNFHGIINNFFTTNLHQPIYNYSSVCFRKDVFKKTGVFDINIDFAEDIDFNIRVNSSFLLAYSSSLASCYSMQSQNQITTSKLGDKRTPNFDKYEQLYSSNTELLKYIDFQRYILAKHYKAECNSKLFQLKMNEINFSNLTYKQQILLRLPRIITLLIQNFKQFFLKTTGIRLTSYN